MADPTGPMIQIGTSPGEVGGLFAGFVALTVAIGHGLKWWLGWTDRRAATRAAKLDAWQKELQDREERFDATQAAHWAEVKSELDQVRAQNAALFGGYQRLAAALRVTDPKNPALREADDLLRAAFPLQPMTPDDMTRTLLALSRERNDDGKDH